MTNAVVLKGGRVFNLTDGSAVVRDIRIEDGRIAEMGVDLPVPYDAVELRLGGALVIPGLIDLHVHAYPGFSLLGTDPDAVGIQNGVTTVVDAGTAGAYTFAGFRRWVVERSATRVFSFLNFSVAGLLRGDMAELASPDLINEQATLQTIQDNRDIIKGMKVRACTSTVGATGIEAIRRAKATARAAGVPLMAHIGARFGNPSEAAALTAGTLSLLEEGDILAHPFTAGVGGLFDDMGRLLPEVLEAVQRGVLFDAAHGLFCLSFRLVRTWLERGLAFDLISTDMNRRSRLQRAISLPVVLSKFLALGLPLREVLAKATLGPARVLGLSEGAVVEVGAPADLSVLEVQEGDWRFVDSENEVVKGHLLLSPLLVVRDGEVFPCLPSRVLPTDRYSEL